MSGAAARSPSRESRAAPAVCILARDTALRLRPEVLLRPPSPAPGPPGSPAIPSRKASRLPGRATPRTAEPPPPTRAVWTLRGPRSARLLQQVVLALRGPPVTRGPRCSASGVRVRRAATPSQERSPARRCGRAPGLPLRSARPPRARRPAAGPLLRAPRAQRPGLRGSGGERRAAAPRRGPECC